MATASITLLENHWQARKVRIVFWVVLLGAGFAFWGGWTIFQTFGLSPADGGVLKPLWQRVALGGFVGALGAAAAGGMYLYISLYALSIAREGNRVSITTMTPFGSRQHAFELSQLGAAAYYHGRMDRALSSGRSIWINAPWITLRAAGRRFPFIIDLQAESIDIGALTALAEGAVKDWQADRG